MSSDADGLHLWPIFLIQLCSSPIADCRLKLGDRWKKILLWIRVFPSPLPVSRRHRFRILRQRWVGGNCACPSLPRMALHYQSSSGIDMARFLDCPLLMLGQVVPLADFLLWLWYHWKTSAYSMFPWSNFHTFRSVLPSQMTLYFVVVDFALLCLSHDPSSLENLGEAPARTWFVNHELARLLQKFIIEYV